MGQAQKKTDISTRKKDLPIKKIDSRVTEELVISRIRSPGCSRQRAKMSWAPSHSVPHEGMVSWEGEKARTG